MSSIEERVKKVVAEQLDVSGDIDNNGTQSKLVPLLTVEKLITNLDDFEGLSAGGHIVDILMIILLFDHFSVNILDT